MIRLLLVANYSYPLMLGYVLIGLAVGVWIERNNDRTDLASCTAWAGSSLFLGGILLSVGTGLAYRWFVGGPTLPAIITYAGALLMVFAGAFYLLRRESVHAVSRSALRCLMVTGILAFAIYVAHSAVIPARDILAALGASSQAALLASVSLFVAGFTFAFRRVYRLYYG